MADDAKASVELDRGVFLGVMRRLAPFVSRDRRPPLTWVAWECGDGKVTAVATDAYTLAVHRVTDVRGCTGAGLMLIPPGWAAAVRAATTRDDETVAISLDGGRVTLGCGPLALTASAAEFVDWRAALDKHPAGVARKPPARQAVNPSFMARVAKFVDGPARVTWGSALGPVRWDTWDRTVLLMPARLSDKT